MAGKGNNSKGPVTKTTTPCWKVLEVDMENHEGRLLSFAMPALTI